MKESSEQSEYSWRNGKIHSMQRTTLIVSKVELAESTHYLYHSSTYNFVQIFKPVKPEKRKSL